VSGPRSSESRVRRLLADLPEYPRVVASGNGATPWTLLRLLDETVEHYTLHVLNAQPGIPDRDGVTLETAFVGPGARRSPRLSYVPARLSLVPRLYATTLPPDLVLLHTSAPIEGRVSMGAEVNVLPAAIEATRARGGAVVAQVDAGVPYVYGDGEIDLEELDAVLDAEDPLGAPHAQHGPGGAEPAVAAIADRVASLIAPGSTLQLGIGAVPDAVLAGLRDHRGLRIWSEMVSDGILELERRGCLDDATVLTASFLLGSTDLYEWAHCNPRLRLLRTETTNDPARIALNPAMVSVNTALQVDLYGQVNASRVRGRIHSGFGGQSDFVVGALHSTGGQAIIALRSWHPKADCSTIVPMIDEPPTSFQPSSVVTEHGIASLFGHAQEQQARHLIQHAAHPTVREELEEEARAIGLLPTGQPGTSPAARGSSVSTT
jgi:acyl-CoA hydrolase